jgi:hypothetical protein
LGISSGTTTSKLPRSSASLKSLSTITPPPDTVSPLRDALALVPLRTRVRVVAEVVPQLRPTAGAENRHDHLEVVAVRAPVPLDDRPRSGDDVARARDALGLDPAVTVVLVHEVPQFGVAVWPEERHHDLEAVAAAEAALDDRRRAT